MRGKYRCFAVKNIDKKKRINSKKNQIQSLAMIMGFNICPNIEQLKIKIMTPKSLERKALVRFLELQVHFPPY